MILLQLAQELIDFAACSGESSIKLREHFAEEVAPEIVKNLAKLQKMTLEAEEDNENSAGPDSRPFG